MIKSVSSWICDERRLQTHISMIFEKARSQSLLSFSTQFMTKEKKDSDYIALIIKTWKKTVQVEFFKRISQRITVFVIKTRYNTFQIRFFKRISQWIIVFVIKISYKTFQIRFFKRISQEITVFVIKIRNKTFQIRFFKEISHKVIRETFFNEIKRILSFLSLWSTETRLSSLWSEDTLSHWSREISSSLWSREISSPLWHRESCLLSLWQSESWLLSLWSRKITFSRETWLLSFWSREQTNRWWPELSLCVTKEAKTFNSIQRFSISITLKFHLNSFKIRMQFSTIILKRFHLRKFIMKRSHLRKFIMKRVHLSSFKIRLRFTILYSTSLSQWERSQWERQRFALNQILEISRISEISETESV